MPRPPSDAGASDLAAAFADLHLDDIVRSVTATRAAYDLAPWFSQPLTTVGAIAYRHEVFRDLDDEARIEPIRAFTGAMGMVRDRLARARKSHYRYEQERWILDAAGAYVDAVGALSRDLDDAAFRSRGLRAFAEFLAGYRASPEFLRLVADTAERRAELDGVRYRLRIHGGRVVVSRYDAEPDYGAEVVAAFEKFRQGATNEYPFDFMRSQAMNHVEAAILDRVARLYPGIFAALDEYCARHGDLIDPTIGRFDREIQFYVAYLEHIDRVRLAGLPFCYPDVTDVGEDVDRERESIAGREVFDLALAGRLVTEARPVVTNDFELAGEERILVVSGPNQGGKTTFARTIGQLFHLARLGVPVPAAEARVHLVDAIFTHFERRENVEDLSGKLEDDLRRIQAILARATPASLLVMNESFSSTTVKDQLFIGRRVLGAIAERGPVCVVVTFLDELSTLGPSTVSMVSSVDPEEPARRTFRITRRPADGLAYAMALAEKHRLTYRSVKARVAA